VVDFINQNYGDKFEAQALDFNSYFYPDGFTEFHDRLVQEVSSQDSVLMVCAESNSMGRLITGEYIGHWIILTGVSDRWEADTAEMYDHLDTISAWNWIRISNAFNGRPEYYWWGDFFQSWKYQKAVIRIRLKN
jgi:hypothetical protein